MIRTWGGNGMVRTCDKGHASLEAANWRCPWCEIERLRGIIAADDERLKQAALRVWGEHIWGCDAAEQMAEKIEFLRSRIAELEAELAQARTVEELWRAEALKAQQMLVDDRARVAELEQNAARYRWLRKCTGPVAAGIDENDGIPTGIQWLDTTDLDAAIDAAMREEQE